MDSKLKDPEFKKDVSELKEKVTKGAKEAGEKTQELAKVGLEKLKGGITQAWGFFSSQPNQKKDQKWELLCS